MKQERQLAEHDGASGGTCDVPASVGAPVDRREDLRDSAPRRTMLAAERTYLAWLRTGLGALAGAIAVGRIAPALLGGSQSAYAMLGIGYAALGVFFIVYALLRARGLNAALAAGAPLKLEWWALVVATVLGVALAAGTFWLVADGFAA